MACIGQQPAPPWTATERAYVVRGDYCDKAVFGNFINPHNLYCHDTRGLAAPDSSPECLRRPDKRHVAGLRLAAAAGLYVPCIT